MDNIILMQEKAKTFIVKVFYDKSGYDSFLYFTNNGTVIEKSNLEDKKCCFFNLINNNFVEIDSKNITGFEVEHISFNSYCNPEKTTESELIEQKNKIYNFIDTINKKINYDYENFFYVKQFLDESTFCSRFALEFDQINDKDAYIKELSFLKNTSRNFKTTFIIKKFGLSSNKFDSVDNIELEGFKANWLQYINNFAAIFIEYLKTENNKITDNDIDYKKEMDNLVSEIEKDIKNVNLSGAKTINEALSLWPVLISPPPFFIE